MFKVESLALFKLEQFRSLKLPTYFTKTLYFTTLSLKLGNFLKTYLTMTSFQLVCFYFLLVTASGVVDCYTRPHVRKSIARLINYQFCLFTYQTRSCTYVYTQSVTICYFKTIPRTNPFERETLNPLNFIFLLFLTVHILSRNSGSKMVANVHL